MDKKFEQIKRILENIGEHHESIIMEVVARACWEHDLGVFYDDDGEDEREATEDFLVCHFPGGYLFDEVAFREQQNAQQAEAEKEEQLFLERYRNAISRIDQELATLNIEHIKSEAVSTESIYYTLFTDEGEKTLRVSAHGWKASRGAADISVVTEDVTYEPMSELTTIGAVDIDEAIDEIRDLVEPILYSALSPK